jgi:hypothetical protein
MSFRPLSAAPRPFKATFDQAKGVLAQAEAKLGKTELDVRRYGPLVKDRAISQEEYDDAVQANLEAKAAVVSATAQVEQAQLNLEFTKITSPIDGIASIENRTLAGKIIVYPMLHDVGLIPLAELDQHFPTVAKKLNHGIWCREAEEELLRVARTAL